MTSHRIHALPLHLANQIAAGEVIERPASVVKELVENSLDAGATEINIEIEGAGSHLIRVSDNGIGIHPDDLQLALSRHATSKLNSSEQLSRISSLGFRGEALPSISSVSQLIMTSRQKESDHAWQIEGETNTITPASHPQGTRIDVRDLFFNLPARRHFLKSNKTERHHILTTLQRLALSHFEIAFNCHLSDKQQLKLPIATTDLQQRQRLAKICGKQFIANSLSLHQHYDDITLRGWLAKAEAHRPQTDVQHFFINGRVIRDRVINHAIKQAYGERIPAGRQPAYVLYLTLPLDRVDINVHPTKHEVRFRDARLIHGLITSALQEALAQPVEKETVIDIKTDTNEIINTVAEKTIDYQSVQNIKNNRTISKAPFGEIITLLHHRYAITQSEQGPLLLDLQQADLQIRHQQLQLAIKTNSLSSRPILVPIKLSVTLALIATAQQHVTLLDKFAIELEVKTDYILIKRIPSLFSQADIKQLIIKILTLLRDKGNEQQLEQLLSQELPPVPIIQLEQAKQLLSQLNSFSINSNWCSQLDQQTLDSLFSA